MKIEADECRAALTLIRRTIEEHCPPGVLPSEEMVNGLYGPELTHEAQAIAAAIVATIDQMQLRVMMKPPSPSIRS
ncbi:hypothetical protein EOA13_22085 [Mesorhizobium sp. M7A.F.Ca.US.011.01.1.1]|uniref:hypothetical protein n=1 Tax=Mesorhizobium sp. M7A.F.Ca.US.011.01.1.1 TaxID=2496741 RepID=UPI000FCBB353|nr:hypothetical protein [Mesorhizobium sp. M7A.F.Ca.US.011.01.1.1]RUX26812.1 hypothetical protein EOA13_22085 [Mesorhizobium sp. M7A.F.Ca.US.011.01.1.1]